MISLRKMAPAFSLSLLALSGVAQAKTTLPIVSNYQVAGDAATWAKGAKAKGTPIPAALISEVTIEDPSRAFLPPYQNIFLQNDRIIVCEESCDSGSGSLTPELEGKDFRVALRGKKSDASLLRQATVYFWVNRLFDKMETLGFKPSKRLIVTVDRDVKEEKSGAEETNNAFFNNEDWTLSFLPARNGFLSKLLGGGQFLPSSYDGSVAMHETTHSVFQALIGDILNPEIYGLHEAFADYFSMTVTESPTIGTIMLKGKPIRRADKILEYKPAMEAHDLGNVVVSALWKSRTYFGDKDQADKTALETIRVVSSNPYSSAGEVGQAYLRAMDTAAAQELKLNPGLKDAIASVWASAKLVPNTLTVDTSVLQGPVHSENFIKTSFEAKDPRWAADEMGTPAMQQVTLTLLDSRPGPDDTRWFLIADGEGSEAPIWILYSAKISSILAAYDSDLKMITPENSAAFKKLIEVGGTLTDLLGWTYSFGQNYRDFYNKKWGTMRLLFKREHDHVSPEYFAINGGTIAGSSHVVKMRRSFLGLLLGGLMGKDARAQLKSLKQLTFYTVPTESLKTAVLPELTKGETLVGYKVRYRTGAEETILLEGVGLKK